MTIRQFKNSDIEQVIDLQNEWFTSRLLPSYVSKNFDNEYEIMYLYISPDKRGNQLGRKLIQSTEAGIKKLGAKKTILAPATEVNQERLINYYESLGYILQKDRMFRGISHKIMSKEI
ncbi:MAG: GNAT family N-acetyltransferase [Desulfobacula sp.]|jgi:GNAT superfamily N-acetyltransferase|nr:GNAT family N-acetyltransferase [Desulfobacula sp.]